MEGNSQVLWEPFPPMRLLLHPRHTGRAAASAARSHPAACGRSRGGKELIKFIRVATTDGHRLAVPGNLDTQSVEGSPINTYSLTT